MVQPKGGSGFNQKEVQGSTKRRLVVVPQLCRALVVVLSLLLLCSSLVSAAGVQPLFDLSSPTGGPFPSDLFTAADPSHNTGLRVNLPKPDCAARPSDCTDIDVINTLDGFNLQPRLSIPFSGPIDVTTVNSQTVFLLSLGSTRPGRGARGQVIGINQVVWDPATHTLHAESDELLDQHTRYAMIVTRGVRDADGDRLWTGAFREFRRDLEKNSGRKAYRRALKEAMEVAKRAAEVWPHNVVAVSVFTTQSSTAILEKIRDQIKAGTPAPADFLLGPGGGRTVFPVSKVTGITVKRQVGTAPTFQESPLQFFGALQATPGVGQIAFGKYLSPNYLTAGQFIPPVGTRTGTPAVQGTNEIFFNLVLPAGEKPPGGWPVAILGHAGTTDTKNDTPLFLAAGMAARGFATIMINVVGVGGGPLGTLRINRASGDPVPLPAGGRGIDLDGNGQIGLDEGLLAAPPRGIISRRDGFQQTVADLMQLVRVIEVGMDLDGDGASDLNRSRIYYFGASLGGIYGTPFLAVEPGVRAGVLTVPGGPFTSETSRLAPGSRPAVGTALSQRVPSLINVGGLSSREFNENLPLRNQPPVINDVAGAMELQELFDHLEWVRQAGDPVAYAPHLRKAPLDGVPARPVLLQFARGDQTIPNPTTTAMLRAGELADRATFYRHDLAFNDPQRNPTGKEVPKDPHLFRLYSPGFFPAVADVGEGARQQIAEFFASDGATVIDPDGAGPLFEVPIAGPLPEELNFIP